MRLPFLRPKPPATAARGRAAAAAVDDTVAVQAARTRARRRLVGALVLLVIGIVGFPLLFETQPRPLPADTPIDVARRGDRAVQQGAIQPVTQQPESRPLPAVPPPDAGNETSAPPGSTTAPLRGPAPTPADLPAAVPATAPGPPPAASAARPRASQPAPLPAAAATPAAAPLAPAAVASAAVPDVGVPAVPASSAGRYVVQVGAYSDAGALRDARSKVERLGIKTYTQVVDTPAGQRTRVRVGPFASRDDAVAAAAKVKRSGLPAAILAL